MIFDGVSSMKPKIEVRVTVVAPALEENLTKRTGLCQLLVESTSPLPRSPYEGTVRIGGIETTATGEHPCRLLKHFTIEFLEDVKSGAFYQVVVDLSDEWPKPLLPNIPQHSLDGPYASVSGPNYSSVPPPAILPPKYGARELSESLEVVSKRIAGIFGRYCEEYRPPSVAVRLDT